MPFIPRALHLSCPPPLAHRLYAVQVAIAEARGFAARNAFLEALRHWCVLAEETRYDRVIHRRAKRMMAWLQWRRGLKNIRRRCHVAQRGAAMQVMAAEALFSSLTAPGRRSALNTWRQYVLQANLSRKRMQLTLAEWRPTVGPRRCWRAWVAHCE